MIRDINTKHQPKGSSKGGEFAPKEGGLTQENAEDIESRLKSAMPGRGTDPLEKEGDEWRFAIREFGRWENPPGTEEDEDYDWQQPTKETVSRIKSSVAAVQKNYPKAQIEWSVEEKNWIGFRIRPATLPTKKDGHNMIKFTDRLVLDGEVRKTRDGYAVALARVARGGNVQTYFGYELGVDKETVRVYRPANEVFKKDAIATYAGVPVTLGHPGRNVTADNWREHAVGESGEEVMRDGEFVRVPLMLRDAKAISALTDGTRELSMGYEASLTMADGLTPEGEKFDAVMTNFKMNHVALVKRARGGGELRFGDGAMDWGANPVRQKPTEDERIITMELRKVLVDGLQVETTEQGAAAIAKLVGDIQTGMTKLADTEKAHAVVVAGLETKQTTAIAAKDAEIAELNKKLAGKDAEIDALKGKIISDAELDKKVAARASLLAVASAIIKDSGKEVKFDGLSDADVRKAAVIAVLGDDMVKDKAAAYIDARFEILSEDVQKKLADSGGRADAFAAVRQDGITQVAGDADKVRLAAEQAERDAWKGAKAA